MAKIRWGEANWPSRREEIEAGLVAILPVGAVEAHGPHLPLGTDGLIAEAMARAAVGRLAEDGVTARILPTLDYTAAPFAEGFAGTVSIRPETATALVVDIGRSLAAQGVELMAIANAHFDPANISALYAAVEGLADAGLEVVLPDVTRRPWALRLTEEFRSGACHAGSYEGSIVLAERPELVDDAVRRELPENPVSLSEAIRAGRSSFEEIGGEQAYFGDPAAATAAEGRETIETLGAILAEAVLEAKSRRA